MVHNSDNAWCLQRWQDVKHFVGAPISIQSIWRAHKSGEGAGKAAVGEAGLNPPPSGFGWTPAERKAYDALRAKQGQRTPEQLEELDSYLERKQAGQLQGREGARARVSDRRTFLQRTLANHDITFDEALPIWNAMSPEEKQQNKAQLVTKYNAEVRQSRSKKRLVLRQKLNQALAPSQNSSPIPWFLRTTPRVTSPMA